jgi:hypothetical protein
MPRLTLCLSLNSRQAVFTLPLAADQGSQVALMVTSLRARNLRYGFLALCDLISSNDFDAVLSQEAQDGQTEARTWSVIYGMLSLLPCIIIPLL